jgi:hypothetical protein
MIEMSLLLDETWSQVLLFRHHVGDLYTVIRYLSYRIILIGYGKSNFEMLYLQPNYF